MLQLQFREGPFLGLRVSFLGDELVELGQAGLQPVENDGALALGDVAQGGNGSQGCLRFFRLGEGGSRRRHEQQSPGKKGEEFCRIAAGNPRMNPKVFHESPLFKGV